MVRFIVELTNRYRAGGEMVILGELGCIGLVKGACDYVEMGNLTALLSKMSKK